MHTNAQRKSVFETYSESGWHIYTSLKEVPDYKSLTGKKLLIFTDELLMRGIDFRAHKGIDLYLDVPLSNERAYIQALGRVGRHDDDCERYIRDVTQKFKHSKQQ